MLEKLLSVRHLRRHLLKTQWIFSEGFLGVRGSGLGPLLNQICQPLLILPEKDSTAGMTS